MPRGDRTGPRGMGSGTGRRLGFCSGYGQPGYMNPAPAGGFGFGGGHGFGGGRGFGGGFGRGRGFGGGFAAGWNAAPYAPYPGATAAPPVYSKETEKEYLESEISYMRSHLGNLEDRLKSIQDED